MKASDLRGDGPIPLKAMDDLIMYTQAIFSSQSPDYLIPFQPETGDTVKVRLRTRKEDRIQCVLVIDDGQEEKKIPMTADLTLKTDQLFLWYAAEFRLGQAPLHYYFEITANDLRAHGRPAANELRGGGRRRRRRTPACRPV